MANLYMSGSNPIGNVFAGGGAGTSAPTPPIRPGQEVPQPGSPAATPPNMIAPQAVRPTGSPQGFDPQYLQNLVTSIGGLFSRPQGNLSFNPLGDLSQSGQTTGFGNSPVPGLPNTMLQDALNGLGFAFQPPSTTSTTPARGNRGNDDNGFGGRGPRLNRL